MHRRRLTAPLVTAPLVTAPLVAAALALTVAGCGNPSSAGAPTPPPAVTAAPAPAGTAPAPAGTAAAAASLTAAQRASLAVAEGFTAAVNRGDEAAVRQAYAPDARFDSVGRVYPDREAIMSRFLVPEVLRPGGQYRTLSVRPGEGDRIVVEYDFATGYGGREHFTYDYRVVGGVIRDVVGRYV